MTLAARRAVLVLLLFMSVPALAADVFRLGSGEQGQSAVESFDVAKTRDGAVMVWKQKSVDRAFVTRLDATGAMAGSRTKGSRR